MLWLGFSYSIGMRDVRWSMRSLDVRAKLEGGGVEEIEGRSVLHSD